ncbi:hypothetical protein FHG87_023672 [Trinorchestia longiramus]|nr:hypothetical protein FHG87_023672 [Trinorchestia longiramus]
MYGMNVMAWNGGDLEKLELLQNRVERLALGTPKWTAVEVIREDLGMDCTASKKPTSVLHELTAAEVKRLCCRHDFIKQETAAENFMYGET